MWRLSTDVPGAAPSRPASRAPHPLQHPVHPTSPCPLLPPHPVAQVLSNGNVSSGVGVYWMFYTGGDFTPVPVPAGFPGGPHAAGATLEGMRMRPGLAMSQVRLRGGAGQGGEGGARRAPAGPLGRVPEGGGPARGQGEKTGRPLRQRGSPPRPPSGTAEERTVHMLRTTHAAPSHCCCLRRLPLPGPAMAHGPWPLCCCRRCRTAATGPASRLTTTRARCLTWGSPASSTSCS